MSDSFSKRGNSWAAAWLLCLLPVVPVCAAGKTARPAEIDVPLTNPYMGWGIWAGPRYFDGRQFSIDYNTAGFGDDAPLFGWVPIDWMWSDLEPEEGRFEWRDLDRIIGYWGKRGKQAYLRVWVTDDPGWNGAPGNEVCPEWLWKAGARYREYTGEGKSRKREPDYADNSVTSIVSRPKTLSPGAYDVRIALTDETGAPAVRLAIAGDDANCLPASHESVRRAGARG